MNLPDLPKQHKKKEADFGVQFRHWLVKNPQFNSCAFELKHTRGKDSFPFSELKVEQIAYANKIQSNDGVLIRNDGRNGEPDYTFLKNTPTYIVIKYPKEFFIIPIQDFIKEKDSSKRKSLTEDRAREIGQAYFLA